MPSQPKADHVTGLTTAEYALLAYLRLHPDVAKTYGIETCSNGCTGCKKCAKCAGVNGKTSIGWMLMHTLRAQGMHVEW